MELVQEQVRSWVKDGIRSSYVMDVGKLFGKRYILELTSEER